MPTMTTELIVKMVGDGADPDLAKVLASRGARAYAQVEQRLGESDYFAGDEFTAADIMMLFPLTTGRMFVPRDLAPFPNIRAYLQRIGARPAFRTAMAKADPDLAPMLTLVAGRGSPAAPASPDPSCDSRVPPRPRSARPPDPRSPIVPRQDRAAPDNTRPAGPPLR